MIGTSYQNKVCPFLGDLGEECIGRKCKFYNEEIDECRILQAIEAVESMFFKDLQKELEKAEGDKNEQ